MGEPLYSLNVSVITRSAGQTAARSCAYVLRERIVDTQRAKDADYADYHDPALFKGVFPPATAKASWRDAMTPIAGRVADICQAVEDAADHSTRWRDACLGRHIKGALFPQLTLQQNLYLLQDWIKKEITRPGY